MTARSDRLGTSQGGAEAINEVTEGYTPEGEAAVSYANRGWRCLPIKSGTKKPAFAAWPTEASNCPGDVFEWFTGRYRGHGVGIATGRESGVFVLDVDVNGGKAGDEQLADLERQHGALPDTFTVTTGSGGAHLYFRYPEGVTITNANRLPSDIDVRGDGGQVLAPPTTHPNGRRYEPDLFTDDLTDAPGWLIDLVKYEEPTTPAPSTVTHEGESVVDRWAARTDWADLLVGWTLTATIGQERQWTRPGKDTRGGISATTHHGDADTLKVFTSSVPELEADQPYTKQGFVAAMQFGGDFNRATRWIAEQMGEAHERVDISELFNLSGTVRDNLIPDRPNPIAHLLRSAVDFGALWTEDHVTEDWLCEPFLPRGRQVMIFAEPKVGKSLIGLEVAAALATGRKALDQSAGDPIHVLYIDAEMSRGDLWARLTDLGYGPDDDLSRLHYHQHVSELSPLDTDRGGLELAALVEHYGAELIAIDTLGQTIEGEDNSADTYNRFARYTSGRLKSLGVTTLLVDHSGHTEKGRPMGSVKKIGNADVIWRLKRTDGQGLQLDCSNTSRINWVPHTVDLIRETEPLRHVTTTKTGVPPGTKELVLALDRLGVPVNAGRVVAERALRDAGYKFRGEVSRAAIRCRKMVEAGELFIDPTPQNRSRTASDE